MQRLAAVTEAALKAFTAALLVAMVLVILSQVVSRYALNLSLAWTEEVGRYLFVWICLLGASLGYRLGQHSGYQSVVSALPAAAQRWVLSGVDGLVACFSVILLFSSRELIEVGLGQVTPAIQIRIAYIYVAFPVSALTTLVFVADSLRQRMRPVTAH